MRLMLVCNDLPYFTAHRLHVARAALRAGHRVEVLGPEQSMPPAMQAAINEGMVFTPLPLVRSRMAPLADLRTVWQLARALGRADVVQAITIKPVLFAGLALHLRRLAGRRLPRLVATIPGLGTVFSAAACAGLKGRLRRRLVERLYRLAIALPDAQFTFETAADRDVFVQHLGLDIACAHVMRGTGVDMQAFAPSPPRTGLFTVLFAGRLLHGKGIDVVLDAASCTAPERISWAIAGWRDDTPMALGEAEIAALAAHPSIRFLGHVADMPALLRSVDALALPSSYPEGIPRALIEAAASGIPAIASDFAGARAVIEDGVTGLILPQTTGAALAQAAGALAALPDRGAAMGQAARAHVEQGGFAEGDVQQAFLRIFTAGASQP